MSGLKPYLESAKALAEKAYPEPWEARCPSSLDNHASPRGIWSEYGWVAQAEGSRDNCIPNAAFIAASRSLVPQLVAVTEVLMQALEEIRICDKADAHYISEEALESAQRILEEK